MNILIVEDNADLCANLKELLEFGGHSASLAYNGLEALQLLEGQGLEPHLILCDLSMPVMDGLQLIDHIRNHSRMDVPILVITGDDSSDRKDLALNKGANALLQKPFTVSELLNQIGYLQGTAA